MRPRCVLSRWAPEVMCWLQGPKHPPLSHSCQHFPGPPRPVWPSTPFCPMVKSSAIRRTYQSTNTAMYCTFMLLLLLLFCLPLNEFLRATAECVYLCLLNSSGISRLEQQQSPARRAGVAHCEWPRTSLPVCHHRGGGGQWASTRWPGCASPAGTNKTQRFANAFIRCVGHLHQRTTVDTLLIPLSQDRGNTPGQPNHSDYSSLVSVFFSKYEKGATFKPLRSKRFEEYLVGTSVPTKYPCHCAGVGSWLTKPTSQDVTYLSSLLEDDSKESKSWKL